MKTFTLANTDSLSRRSRVDVLGGPGEDVVGLAALVREELAPEGALESLIVERMIRAIDRLHRSASADSAGPLDARAIRGEVQAERALFQALDAFHSLRDRRGPGWGKASPSKSTLVPDDGSVELPTFDGFADWSSDLTRDGSDQASDLDAERWEDRLAFDPEVSETSPVVRETWITVRHVISLIVDGASWSEILRGHPELTEADIRACLAYAIEEEGGILQF